jgi:hypothetical protein
MYFLNNTRARRASSKELLVQQARMQIIAAISRRVLISRAKNVFFA